MALSQVLLATLNLTMTPSLTRGGAWLSGLAESSISPGQGDNWWIKFIQWLSQWLSGIVESPIWHDLDNWWIKLTQWLSEPRKCLRYLSKCWTRRRGELTLEQSQDVLAAIMAWWITFTLIMTLIMVAGFGTAGIITGKVPFNAFI